MRRPWLATVLAVSILFAGCSRDSIDHSTTTSPYPRNAEQATEMYLDTISSDIESVYENLPEARDPGEWARQIYGIFNVVYNHNRPDLFEYTFAGPFYGPMVNEHLPVVEEVTTRKNDPSELDDYVFRVRAVPVGTDFDGESGTIRLEETSYFKWRTVVTTFDMTVARHDVDVVWPNGSQKRKSLLLIEDWDIIERLVTDGG